MSHTLSRFLLIIKIALVASVIVAMAWGWQQLKDPENFPISHIKVQASYAHTDQTTLATALTPYVNQGFFRLSDEEADEENQNGDRSPSISSTGSSEGQVHQTSEGEIVVQMDSVPPDYEPSKLTPSSSAETFK
jgi:hypothetical protein